eukprot:1161108-Pelagomonas_calceolata.AAC.8
MARGGGRVAERRSTISAYTRISLVGGLQLLSWWLQGSARHANTHTSLNLCWSATPVVHTCVAVQGGGRAAEAFGRRAGREEQQRRGGYEGRGRRGRWAGVLLLCGHAPFWRQALRMIAATLCA